MSTHPYLIHSFDPDRQILTHAMDRRFIRRILMLILIAVPVVVLTLAIVQANNRIYQSGKQIRYLEFQRQRLADERLELLLKKEGLLNPDAVARKAAEGGLGPLKPAQIKRIYVE